MPKAVVHPEDVANLEISTLQDESICSETIYLPKTSDDTSRVRIDEEDEQN